MTQRTNVEFNTSIQLICDVFSISATCYRYETKISDENVEIEDWLLRLTLTYKRWALVYVFYIHIIAKVIDEITNVCTVSIKS